MTFSFLSEDEELALPLCLSYINEQTLHSLHHGNCRQQCRLFSEEEKQESMVGRELKSCVEGCLPPASAESLLSRMVFSVCSDVENAQQRAGVGPTGAVGIHVHSTSVFK